jgi:hypothetical protein
MGVKIISGVGNSVPFDKTDWTVPVDGKSGLVVEIVGITDLAKILDVVGGGGGGGYSVTNFRAPESPSKPLSGLELQISRLCTFIEEDLKDRRLQRHQEIELRIIIDREGGVGGADGGAGHYGGGSGGNMEVKREL